MALNTKSEPELLRKRRRGGGGEREKGEKRRGRKGLVQVQRLYYTMISYLPSTAALQHCGHDETQTQEARRVVAACAFV